MTQISRFPLRKEIEKRVFAIFLSSLVRLNQKKEVENFIQDLLSPTEQLMLAKRLSIAFLLRKGYDQRSISKILKVGLATVSRVSLQLQISGKGYNQIINAITKDEQMNDFWSKIDDFITGIVPPKGRNWGNWRSERWLRQRARRREF